MKRLYLLGACLVLLAVCGCVVAEYYDYDEYGAYGPPRVRRVVVYPDPWVTDALILGGIIYGLGHGRIRVHHYYRGCGRITR